jgi:hypothetical protein
MTAPLFLGGIVKALPLGDFLASTLILINAQLFLPQIFNAIGCNLLLTLTFDFVGAQLFLAPPLILFGQLVLLPLILASCVCARLRVARAVGLRLLRNARRFGCRERIVPVSGGSPRHGFAVRLALAGISRRNVRDCGEDGVAVPDGDDAGRRSTAVAARPSGSPPQQGARAGKVARVALCWTT